MSDTLFLNTQPTFEAGDIIEYTDYSGKKVSAQIKEVNLANHYITVKRFSNIFHWLAFYIWFGCHKIKTYFREKFECLGQ